MIGLPVSVLDIGHVQRRHFDLTVPGRCDRGRAPRWHPPAAMAGRPRHWLLLATRHPGLLLLPDSGH